VISLAPKIVCDTNTLISGFLWRGNEYRLLSAILDRKAVLYSSPDLFSEFIRVLSYEKLKPFVPDPSALAEKLESMAVFVKPARKIDAITQDPADNAVLECAIAAQAVFIVSGDEHLPKLRQIDAIPIVTTKNALSRIGIKT